MKTIFTAVLLVSSLSSFASVQRQANPREVAAMCKSIDKEMEKEQVDMAIDVKACLKTKMQVTGMEIGGAEITGLVPMNAPNRPSFKQNCSARIAGTKIDVSTITCH